MRPIRTTTTQLTHILRHTFASHYMMQGSNIPPCSESWDTAISK